MSNNGQNDQRNYMLQQNAQAQAANCGGLGIGQLGQQFGYGPPPSPITQLEMRANELTAFLAIDHDKKRREAQAELNRISAALECLRAREDS